METPKSLRSAGGNGPAKAGIAAMPGSYDPVTVGHTDIIRRAAALFDKVYVVAMENPDKAYLFTPRERLEFLKEAVGDIENVIIEYSGGFFYEYATQRGVRFIVKGLRSAYDFDYEAEIAAFNRLHAPQAETVFLVATEGLESVSSSRVREMASSGEALDGLVGVRCAEVLKSKLL